MARFIDETGNLYGRLKVLRRGPNNSRGAVMWVCRCECGVEVTVHGTNLRRGRTKSCGPCGTYRTHGRSRQSNGRPAVEYDAWARMRQRCSNPNHPQWKAYGGRGIRVMPEWDGFARFFADMGERPSPRHVIERRDKDGHFGKANCYWGEP